MSTAKERNIMVFLYGTLKRGQRNHWVMQQLEESRDAEFVEEATACGMVVLEAHGLPAMYSCGQGVTTMGEVWAVTPGGLHALDFFEGHPHFYRRIRTTAYWAGGPSIVSTYLGPALPDGGGPTSPVASALVRFDADRNRFTSNYDTAGGLEVPMRRVDAWIDTRRGQARLINRELYQDPAYRDAEIELLEDNYEDNDEEYIHG